MKVLIGKIIALLFLMNLSFINTLGAFAANTEQNNSYTLHHKTFSKTKTAANTVTIIAELEELEEDETEGESFLKNDFISNILFQFDIDNILLFNNYEYSKINCSYFIVKSNALSAFKLQHSFLI